MTETESNMNKYIFYLLMIDDDTYIRRMNRKKLNGLN